MRKLNRGKGALLAHTMGTGKTVTTLFMIRMLGLYNCYTALVVAPATVVNVWKEEQQTLFQKPGYIDDYWTSRQAFDYNRVVVVEDKITFWQLAEYMSAGKIIVMSHIRYLQILLPSKKNREKASADKNPVSKKKD